MIDWSLWLIKELWSGRVGLIRSNQIPNYLKQDALCLRDPNRIEVNMRRASLPESGQSDSRPGFGRICFLGIYLQV